jgi:hypothetical protein
VPSIPPAAFAPSPAGCPPVFPLGMGVHRPVSLVTRYRAARRALLRRAKTAVIPRSSAFIRGSQPLQPNHAPRWAWAPSSGFARRDNAGRSAIEAVTRIGASCRRLAQERSPPAWLPSSPMCARWWRP